MVYLVRRWQRRHIVNGRATHGGRKNCSNATYMPRNISSRRKYLPARSKTLSPSSHFFCRGNRNPGGGGPAGVAALGEVVEKNTAVAGDGNRAVLRSAVLGRPRASIINGLALAIAETAALRCWWWWRLKAAGG
jgi:hypothetical protein